MVAYPHLSQREANWPDRIGQPLFQSPDVEAAPHCAFMQTFVVDSIIDQSRFYTLNPIRQSGIKNLRLLFSTLSRQDRASQKGHRERKRREATDSPNLITLLALFGISESSRDEIKGSRFPIKRPREREREA